MLVRIRLIFALVIALTTMNAWSLNLVSYHFSDSYRYGLLDDSLQEKFPGRYVFTASYGHVRSPFYYSDSDLDHLRKAIIDYNNVLTLGGSYYVNKNVSVGIDVGAVNNNVFRNSYNTFTDTTLKSRINLRRQDGFSLSLNPQIILPTGDTENFSTVDSVGGALSVVAEQALGKFHLLGSVGALSAKNNAYEDVDHRQLLLTQLGISYDVMDKLNINLETWRNFPLVDDKLQDEGKYFVTAKHKTHKNFSTFGGGGLSGLDKVERRTWSFFAGIKFHEAEPAPVAIVQKPIQVVAAAPVRKPVIPREPIYFAHDHYDLTPQEMEKLDQYITFIQENDLEVGEVMIEGHASAVGPRAYNLALSKKRANTVRQYLETKGIEAEHISTLGHGEDFPQHPDPAMNRKVNLTFGEKKDLL